MSLKAQLQNDLGNFMKTKNENAVTAIRMLKTAIMRLETSGTTKEASDEEILQLVNKEIKQRRDSIEQFEKGNRQTCNKEKAEIVVLENTSLK